MKKISLIAVFVVSLFLVDAFSQVSSEITRFNAKESDGIYKVELTFTADSTGTLVSEQFSVPKWDIVYNTTPITFRMKNVATYGVPKAAVYLQGIFSSITDTLALDTLRLMKVNQGETDTTGELTLNRKFAPAYRIYIDNNGGDITSGRISLYFPLKK